MEGPLIVFGVLFLLILIGIFGSSSGNQSQQKVSVADSITDEQLERIHERCDERELTGWAKDSEKITQVIKNITFNTEISEEEARTIYEKCLKHFTEQTLAEEQNEYEEAEYKSGIVGKDKYTFGLLEELDALENQLDNVGAVTNALSMSAMQPKSKNPVASAAVTGAILGPAAGVAAANQAQAQNAKAQDTYNRLQATLAESRRLEYQSAERAKRRAEAIKDYLKKIDRIEIDTSHPSLYFSYVELEVKDVAVSVSHKYLSLKVHSDLDYENEDIPEYFWDKYGNVDGSVRLTAKYDGSEIGAGYLCAPGFGGTTNYSIHHEYISDYDYGFDCCSELEALVQLYEEWNEDWDVTKVQIEFEPIKIWVRTRK